MAALGRGPGRGATLAVDLPAEADAHRAEVRAFLDDLQARATRPSGAGGIADAGYLVPHWPAPVGPRRRRRSSSS